MSLNVLMFVPHLLDKMVTKFPSEYKNNSLSFRRDLLSNAFFSPVIREKAICAVVLLKDGCSIWSRNAEMQKSNNGFF